MRIHRLKTHVSYFQALRRGDKTFEARLNDRDFQVGDVLDLIEWSVSPTVRVNQDGSTETVPSGPTDDHLFFRISYVMTGGRMGLAADHVVLGIQPVKNPYPSDDQES